jgi:hypothetical protein
MTEEIPVQDDNHKGSQDCIIRGGKRCKREWGVALRKYQVELRRAVSVDAMHVCGYQV